MKLTHSMVILKCEYEPNDKIYLTVSLSVTLNYIYNSM